MAERDLCLKCRSPLVMGDVRIMDRVYAEDLRAEVRKRPEARLLKGKVSTPLRARVCGACGFTELYAQDPIALLAAHDEGRLSRLQA